MEIPTGDLIAINRMTRVDTRIVWKNEAQHFTPWLADNLDLLGEVLHLELELEDQEKNVGVFRADILARDASSDSWVLIENQLERTDHTHLGQLITYASGLQAVTIVWIAAHFTEEHRAALDWLNEITEESVNFFGLEIELWSINDNIAPKFNIVCKPNSWKKKVITITKGDGIINAPSKSRTIILQTLEEFRPNALTPAEIANKSGLVRTNVKVILRRLLAEGLVIAPYRGQYILAEEEEEA